VGLEELKRERRRRGQILGDKHPEMVRLESDMEAARDELEAETQKVVRSVESSYRTALRQEQRLEADLEPVQRELQELKRKAVEQGVLKREAEANQQLLRSLMQRSVESGVEAELKATPVEIVERAEAPTTPFSPRRGRNYQLALLVGLALGLALVYVVEQMDRSIKTPEEVKEQLGLPFLGMIPDMTAGRNKGASPLILETPRSSLAEAYRVVRTNLLFSSPDSTSRRLVVTSVHPGEGKSTTVTNLAVSLAQNGSRVLVIDADLRRPVLDKHFALSKTPGLSDLIAGECGPAEAIRRTKHDGLSVIPCGSVAPNPAELLGSARMRELLDGFPDTYEWILLDAPPVFAIADAPVLSASMDGLLLVVAAERTTRPALRRAIDQIFAVGGKIVGVVLNRLDVERNDYYGHPYSNYYHGYYREEGSPRGREPHSPEHRDAPVISD
jgi:capsular exopolysaccharide synthesis family protein